MKSYYLLTVETNLTKTIAKLNTKEKAYERFFKVFEDFESAKTSMRSVLKDFATSENDLFDGNGNVIGFDEDFEQAIEEAEDLYESEVEVDILKNTPEILKSFFLGDAISFSDEFYEEIGITDFEISEDLTGWEQIYDTEREVIPFRFCDIFTPPFMQINAFEMEDPEKTYVVRLRSGCEEWEQPAFIQLELRKIDME